MRISRLGNGTRLFTSARSPVTPGKILWQCRRCEKVIDNLHSPDIYMSLICHLNGIHESGGKGFGVSDQTVHECSRGEFGIADLIGASETKEEKVKE
jgi:hypothetical protein